MNNLLNKIVCDNAEHYLEQLPSDSIDLIVTSPPYDNLRDYNGYTWNFEKIAHESFRVLKQGGVLVWVIGDKVINGSESLTSFKQAIYFVDCVKFKLHDHMIFQKDGGGFPESNRYWQVFQNMFVFSKGKPLTFNPLKEKSKNKPTNKFYGERQLNGKMIIPPNNTKRTTKEYKNLDNVWLINAGYMKTTKDKLSYKHPAMFPEELAKRHILTWSNEGDIVLDYFMGSGTTAKMALLNNRQYMGCDISQEYVNLANERLDLYSVRNNQ